MKFIFAVALLCIGSVAAQTAAPAQNSGLVESLEKRASVLLARVHETLAHHRQRGEGHLLQALDRQAVLVEALALDLKNQLNQPHSIFHLHHIHVIEEDLLALENRVSEEIAIIQHIGNNGHNPNPAESTAQLVARGQQLVKDAQATVTAKPQAKEIREIQSEVIVVEALIKAIQAKPAPTAAELAKDQAELARQEQTLRQLIEKANARKA